jgi:hypothetical protein
MHEIVLEISLYTSVDICTIGDHMEIVLKTNTSFVAHNIVYNSIGLQYNLYASNSVKVHYYLWTLHQGIVELSL